MKKLLLLFTLLTITPSTTLHAQTDDIATGLSGDELIAFLQANFSITDEQSYNAARDAMFGSIDNVGGTVRGVYSGQELTAANRTEAQNQGFNTEHVWPQSFFNQIIPLRSDIHHLFITRSDVNSARSNFPFAEIPDEQTDRWYRDTGNQTSIPDTNIDEYSELNNNTSFEPREDHKGNIARAVFYFWAIYQNDPAITGDESDNEAFFDGMKDVLLQWHDQDPVTQEEVNRSIDIEVVQGNRNPFIHDTTLVRRAFFGGEGNGGGTGGQGNANTLIITGVIDGPLAGGTPKAIELYAIEDIPDLGVFGIGAANNGGGSDGVEFQLSGSVDMGDFVYIATDSASFSDWFDFDATFIDETAAAINGDDAIELFYDSTKAFSGNEIVIDVFGEIDTDGTGELWEYTNGWAYRMSGTEQDSTVFNIDNWFFSGVDALTGETDNGSAQNPFPGEVYVFEIVIVSNEEESTVPTTALLLQNFPNPFNPTTQIRYELSRASEVRLTVYDMLGREVNVIVNQSQSAGSHEITFNATGLSSGVYIYELRTNSQVLSKTMTLIK